MSCTIRPAIFFSAMGTSICLAARVCRHSWRTQEEPSHWLSPQVPRRIPIKAAIPPAAATLAAPMRMERQEDLRAALADLHQVDHLQVPLREVPRRPVEE